MCVCASVPSVVGTCLGSLIGCKSRLSNNNKKNKITQGNHLLCERESSLTQVYNILISLLINLFEAKKIKKIQVPHAD